jgi:hypothetical protein
MVFVVAFVMLLGVQKLLVWLLPPKSAARVPAAAAV